MEVENILSDLIKLRTENPPGNELLVAQYLKRLFDDAGVRNEVIATPDNRGHLFASIGRGERSLLYLAHSDVVPAGEGWDFDPFSGDIRDGYVLGRGALDCKGLMAAEVYALLHLARNARLNGRLIFAATADEEVGGAQGVKYLVDNVPNKLKADFIINEGGEEPKRIDGKMVYFVQTGEKGPVWTRLRARGVSCHGSLPLLGDNAVVKMARAVTALAAYKPKITLVPEIREMVQTLARLKGSRMRITERNIDRFIAQFDERTTVAYLNAVTRMTVSTNFIHGGLKTNIVPDDCEASVDIRTLPGQDMEYVLSEIRKTIGDEIEVSIPYFASSVPSSATSPHFLHIVNAVKKVVGDNEVVPCFSSGATDSRFLRDAGIPAYGEAVLSPDYDPGIITGMHGRNERIDVKSLRLKAAFLIELARSYLA